ncbi:NO-inducible flavohemoprotein [Paracoccus sp. DMF-8]|uniref:NO-inducible flavohemoprotein n=1 Tax=Paracoccus sp. DMF-8 TaxID=3019445 RepID=UPI0023E89158|nr:NO-inducible flavohemoprotein [Paracoccus sp. DMF-8]MDF3607058.1 NO-inducible flavohemoprotein [Paracoccus sp. DMF-8]
MAKPLSPATIATVKATIPALQAHGFDIVKAMYARLFRIPEVAMLFNASHQAGGDAQPKALTGAILAYAQNIENPGVLAAAIERITQKHVSLQILPEHYPHVADALLGAIGDVLGEAATPDVLNAWGEAYWFLADVLIAREAQAYQDIAAQPGGWTGWRRFTVADRHVESEQITSFILRPVDGGAVMAHRPGQYLAFDIAIPGQGSHRRNYSISSAPNKDHYRITVKRDRLVSSWLHDAAVPGTELNVAAPAEDFFLQDDSTRPLVLLSGGVGLTPMLSILAALPKERRKDVTWIHATHNGRSLVQGKEIREMAGRSAVFFESPDPHEAEGVSHEVTGRVTPEWLAANTPVADADFYICGPKPFMAMAIHGLEAAGAKRVYHEFFGPAEDLAA